MSSCGILITVSSYRKSKGKKPYRTGKTGKKATVILVGKHGETEHPKSPITGTSFRDMYKRLIRSVKLPVGVKIRKRGNTYIPEQV